MRKPLVSVLINNFNKENFCEKAVKSALDQDYSKIEVIFYDEFSTNQENKNYEVSPRSHG